MFCMHILRVRIWVIIGNTNCGNNRGNSKNNNNCDNGNNDNDYINNINDPKGGLRNLLPQRLMCEGV